MLSLFLAMAAAAYPSTPTGSAIVSLGSSSARSCYQAAEARAATVATINECDLALDGGLSRSDRVATLVNRGILKMIRGNNAAAEADFDAALGIEPAQAEAWLNKGVSLYQRGDSRAAVGFRQGDRAEDQASGPRLLCPRPGQRRQRQYSGGL